MVLEVQEGRLQEVLEAQGGHLNLTGRCRRQVFESIFFLNPRFLFPTINIDFTSQYTYLFEYSTHSSMPWSIFQYFTFISMFEYVHL